MLGRCLLLSLAFENVCMREKVGKLVIVSTTAMAICRRETEEEGIPVGEDRSHRNESQPPNHTSTHLLLGRQGCRVCKKIAHRLFCSTWELNPRFLDCEPSVLPLQHGGPYLYEGRESLTI